MSLKTVPSSWFRVSFQTPPLGACFFFQRYNFLKKKIKKKYIFKKKMYIVGQAPKRGAEPGPGTVLKPKN